MAECPIQFFFKDCSIFVTGGTGFVGKVLVEKLLRSCPDIKFIYVLLRCKAGQHVEARFKKYLQDPVFNKVKSDCPSALDKILVTAGDLSEPGLGLKETDKEEMKSNVNVVFHCAASVRFNESMKNAVTYNTLGTLRVIEICRQMTNLKVFVHVSTAFIHPHKYEINEKVYPPPGDPDEVIQKCLILTDEDFEYVMRDLKKTHPNTYTLTKAMAEWVVYKNTKYFPMAIVRPSGVIAAWQEPFPGWVDNLGAGTAVFAGIIQGIIHHHLCDSKLAADFIPVDFVVNTLIAAAWQTGSNKSNFVRVYNCTTSSHNPLYWSFIKDNLIKYARDAPNMRMIRYPTLTYWSNKFMYRTAEMLYHFVPAIVIDAGLTVQGWKPRLLKWVKYSYKTTRSTSFFSCQARHFQYENVISLLNNENVKDTFYTDVTKIDWNMYMKLYVDGIRKYILKENDDDLLSARKRLQKLYWIHQAEQIIIMILLLITSYHLWSLFK